MSDDDDFSAGLVLCPGSKMDLNSCDSFCGHLYHQYYDMSSYFPGIVSCYCSDCDPNGPNNYDDCGQIEDICYACVTEDDKIFGLPEVYDQGNSAKCPENKLPASHTEKGDPGNHLVIGIAVVSAVSVVVLLVTKWWKDKPKHILSSPAMPNTANVNIGL